MPIHDLLPSLKLEIKAIDFMRTGNWWNWTNINSPFSRLYLITAGGASVNHHGRDYQLTCGKLHLIPCYCFWNCCCPDWFELYYLHFTSSLAGGLDLFTVQEYNYHFDASEKELRLFQRLLELNPGRAIATFNPHDPPSKGFPRDYLKTNPKKSPGELIESDGILRQLLAPFLATAHEYSDPAKKALKRFKDVFAYIDKNLDRPISLKKLGQVAQLSPTYFSDLFYAVMGTRPIEYINRKRIEKAQYLLCTEDDSIAEISQKVGFSYVPYFSHMFKKYVGSSPHAYRKGHLDYA